MSLLDLPNELLLSIASRLRCASDINSLVRANCRLYVLLNAYLYEYYIRTSNHSALPWVALRGLTNTVLKFLDLGANLQAVLDDNTHTTALYLASRHGHLLIVEALIQSGAHVNAQTCKGVIPLHGAVVGGHENITRVLLEYGADFMKPLPTGARPTILHVASYFGFHDIVQLLLDKGMGIQVKDKDLQTPLHYAVKPGKKDETWHGNITTVGLLLEKKAIRDSWDITGQRPKDLARRNPNSIINLLLQDATNITLDDAILRDQAIQQRLRRKKELEEERIRKVHELAAERAAKLMAREADKKAKEERSRKMEETIEYQKQAEKERLDDISRSEKLCAIRESWAKARIAAESEQLRREMKETRKQQSRTDGPKPASATIQKNQNAARELWRELQADAEERRQNPHQTNRQSCSHSGLGLLKWKGRGQCNICEIEYAKHLFKCVDCGFVACRHCKTAN